MSYVGKKIISYVEPDDEDEDFIFKIEDDSFVTIYAHGDCCSCSWFEKFDETDIGYICGTLAIEDIIGKTIKSIDCDLDSNENGGEIKIYEISINFDDNTEFMFIMKNSSNGYYGGYITIK